MKNFSTIAQLILYQASNFNNPSTLNFNNESISNQEFFNQALYFACGLKEIGFKEKQTFAIIANTNPTWLIVDFGAILAGAITVPIFHNISKENLEFEIKDADVQFLFTDNDDIFSASSDLVRINKDSLKELILLGKKAFEEKKYDLEKLINEIKPEDLATIIYTSGSTGKPKGVELTHKNLVSQIKGTAEIFPLNKNFDVALSFLPLAHIFERMVMMFYISQGITIHFCDDVKNLSELLKKIRPTLMTSVPRMLEKVFAKIEDSAKQKKSLQKFLRGLSLIPN